jgi:hypothetical protein
MQRSLVRISDNFVENIIEWEEGSNWPVPDGYRLDDPVKFPRVYPEATEPAVSGKLIGDMTAEEFRAISTAATVLNADKI